MNIYKMMAIAIAIAITWASVSNATEFTTETGIGSAVKEKNLTILNLHGSWEDMGKEYGTLMQSQLGEMDTKFYYKYFDIRYLPENIGNYLFYFAMERALDAREKSFLKGVAFSSGLAYDHVVVLNLLPYLFTLNEASNGEHCSFISVKGKLSNTGKVLIGRNMDYDTETKEVLDYATLVFFHPDNGDNRVATFGFLGFIPGHTLVNDKGVFVESNDGSYSSPVDTAGMIYNLGRAKLDVLHRDFYASLNSNSATGIVNILQKYQNLSSSFSGIASSNEVLRVENPAGSVRTRQPQMEVSKGQSDEYNYFTNLYIYPFSTAVLTTSDCIDKIKDSPSYACTRYNNINKFLQKSNQLNLQSIKSFMMTPLDQGGIFQTGKSTDYPVDEISLQSIACDMNSLVCDYHDYNMPRNEWITINLWDYFNS